MKMNLKSWLRLMCCSLLLVLSACGGGGDDGNNGDLAAGEWDNTRWDQMTWQ